MIPFQCTFKCAVSGDVEFFKTADKEVLLNARAGDIQDSTVLELSARGEHLDCCQEICKKCPELLYHQTPGQKMTILMSAAWFGKTDLITLFLNTAAEFEKGDKKLLRMLDSFGRSALYHAVWNSKFEASKLLMEADPDFEYCYDNEGQIPLLAAMGRANSGDQIAAKIRKLILEMQPYQSKIRTGDKNSSAIHKAGFHGNLDAIKELIQFCPECAEYVDTNKCNFLHIAVFCRKTNVLKHVLENKDLPSSVLNAPDVMGKTPLDYAALSEDKEMTKLATTYRHHRLRKGKTTRDDYGSSSTSFLPEILQSIHDSLEEKFGSVKKDVASRPTSEILKSPDLCPVRSTIYSIKGMFDLAKPLSSEYTIYRVPERLRSVKAEAYAPMLISVGPFHHDSDRLKSMESDKARYLYCMLHRENSKPLADYVEMAMKLERKARDCYAETFSYTKKEFVEMIILDGCFIVELFLQYRYPALRTELDPIFNNHWIFNVIHRDLLLLENQLPFFVLEELFFLMGGAVLSDGSLSDIATLFFGYNPVIPCHPSGTTDYESNHFVQFVLNEFTCPLRPRHSPRLNNDRDLVFIPTATDLHQVGIQFSSGRVTTYLLEVEFSEGRMTIPSLVVDHRTESLFRNLLAFEQSHNTSTINHPRDIVTGFGASTTIVSDYVTLMDCLINTPDDVKFLRDQGIIHNHLGDNEEVAQLFNKLRCGIVTRSNAFHFYDIFKDVNAYYGTKWNRLKATLRRDYFNNPWARISFGAAVLLLLFATIQTFCSIIQLTPKGKL